jgi:hypothetical protein
MDEDRNTCMGGIYSPAVALPSVHLSAPETLLAPRASVRKREGGGREGGEEGEREGVKVGGREGGWVGGKEEGGRGRGGG